MQGLHEFIPTATKVRYISALLNVGFDTIDFGSFVSPKAIPQMRDTALVLKQLNIAGDCPTKLLAIVANLRGAMDAIAFPEISYLGFPFSISETFQQRNTNSSIADSLVLVAELQNLCTKSNKKLVVYLSMGFGNPYKDPWDVALVAQWIEKLVDLGVLIIALSDTVGVADKNSIALVFSTLISAYPTIEFGAHLHSTAATAADKIEAALVSGCQRFDTAMLGFGGCPLAADVLTGNIATETLVEILRKRHLPVSVDLAAFNKAAIMAAEIFV